MRLLVDKGDAMSIRAQCRLLGIHRPSFYHQPQGESAENPRIME